MKKVYIIPILLAIFMSPVVLAGFIWAIIARYFRAGQEIAGLISEEYAQYIKKLSIK